MKFVKKESKKRCFEIRKRILEISQLVPALHIGGSFSSVEIIESIYFNFLKKKDKFILSKGHTGILQYTVLEKKGIIKKKDLEKYCTKDGFLGVHPDYGNPGIEASTGALGHGLAIAAGMAIASSKKDSHYYVLISDGELHEGSVWEAALFVGSRKLKNLTLIIDNNDLQSSTKSSKTHPSLYPIGEKFNSFGWKVVNCKGNSVEDINRAISKKDKIKPLVVVAKTKKGFPISFMQDVPMWHYRSPDKLEFKKALMELEKKL